MTAPDPKTVVVKLKQPSRNFLFNLAQTGGVIVDDASRATIATASNGSGPFAVDSYTTNASLVLKANPKYWGTKPALQQVTFRYFSDANALANALKAGDIDIIDNLSPELFGSFESDKANYETVNGATPGEVILAMNNSKAPLDNVKVRQAISYAINKQDVDDIAEQGTAKIIGSHSSPIDPWFKDLSNTYQFDPDKAKDLLKEAGVSDLKLTLDVIPTPYAQASAPVIKDELSRVGHRRHAEQRAVRPVARQGLHQGRLRPDHRGPRRGPRHEPVRQPRLLLALQQLEGAGPPEAGRRRRRRGEEQRSSTARCSTRSTPTPSTTGCSCCPGWKW